jgi:cytochrome c55X
MRKPHAKLNWPIIVCGLTAMAIPLHAAEPTPSRQHELLYLLKQDCGSCHGLTLKGGLGPALTPQALHDKPKAAMVATIMHGRPGTPMPPWSSELSEADARWLVENLYRGVP